jgi:hypothetical protein
VDRRSTAERPTASNPRAATPGKKRGALLPVAIVGTAVATSAALLALRLHFQPPTVPPYVLAGTAGDLELSPGTNFEMRIRPTAPVAGAIAARAFLVREGVVRPWDAPFTIAQDGSVRIAGPVDRLFAGVPRGPWEVAVAVGRPENLPVDPRDVMRARASSPPPADRPAAWRLVSERIGLGG